MKAGLRLKSLAVNAHLKKKKGKSQINNLPLQLKELEIKEQTDPKVSPRKETNKRERSKTIEKNQLQQKVSSLKKKVNKLDKSLTRWIKH